ncbi:DUF2939 domain-containing protein [Massilia sp. W12]|uniref:DUF2939 domain-containing protein n=1 Tax=Massilia sp. W12 TaxID=3126507 RepID=UPI0030CFA663
MAKSISRLIIIVLLAYAAWIVASPHVALRNMRQAAERNDAQAFSSYVDYPQLRESMKVQLQQKMHREAGAVGGFLGALIMNPLLDYLVTPEGMQTIMLEARLADKPRRGQDAKQEEAAARKKTHTSGSYDGWSRYVVEIKHDDGHSLSLVLQRHGLSEWKLSGIRLP